MTTELPSVGLSRAELEADHVRDGVAKWGEQERIGLERQARAKSFDTLRVEYDLRHAPDREQEALDASLARQLARDGCLDYQAMGCLDDGPT